MRQVIIENIAVSSSFAIKYADSSLNQKTREWQLDLKRIASNKDTYTVLSSGINVIQRIERHRIENVLKTIIQQRSEMLQSIRLVDKQGNERVVVRGDGPSRRYINVRRDLFFKQTKIQRPFYTIGTIHKNKGGDAILSFAMNITRNRVFVGVAVFDIKIDSIINLIHSENQYLTYNNAYVFNQGNNLVHSRKIHLDKNELKINLAKEVYNTIKNRNMGLKVFENNRRFWALMDSELLNMAVLSEMEDSTLERKVFHASIPFFILIGIFAILATLIRKKSKTLRRKGSLIISDDPSSAIFRKKRSSLEGSGDTGIRIKDLSNFSYQIRQPLNNILATLALFQQSQLDKKQHDHISKVSLYSEWILELLNQITDYAALKRGKLSLESSEFNVRQVLKEVTHLLETETYKKGIHINEVVHFDVPIELVGDATRLRQVLINLLGNAIKISEDSDINIEISASKKRSKQTLLRIEISESAAGIETEFAHTIFAEVDKNMLTSDQIVQGGIGINITKQLIEMMGGQIGYSDSAMQGNVFWIEVPLGEAESSREQAANGGRLLGKRVLIISTNEGNRKTVASTMAAWGITTESKASYDLTVTTLHRNIDLGHPFDLLMLDVSSKTSIEEVIEFLKDLNSHHVIKDTKRIILINKITTGDEQIVKELGVLSCLSKPINRKHLKTALEDALTESNYPNEILTEDSKLSSQLTPGDSASVLIIDPAKRYQQTLSAIVSTAGIESNVATSLKEAVKAIETKNYSMVLIDQSMPQMNVDEIVRNIRKAEKKVADKREKTQQGMMKTSIVLIVDELNEKRQRHWHKIGVDDFIGKPISNDDMSELMSRWDLLA